MDHVRSHGVSYHLYLGMFQRISDNFIELDDELVRHSIQANITALKAIPVGMTRFIEPPSLSYPVLAYSTVNATQKGAVSGLVAIESMLVTS